MLRSEQVCQLAGSPKWQPRAVFARPHFVILDQQEAHPCHEYVGEHEVQPAGQNGRQRTAGSGRRHCTNQQNLDHAHVPVPAHPMHRPQPAHSAACSCQLMDALFNRLRRADSKAYAGPAHQSTGEPCGMALIVIFRKASFTVVPLASVWVVAGSGS